MINKKNGFYEIAAAIVVAVLFLTTPERSIAQEQVLNMRDADIRAFISDVSMMTGRTFIVDPRVQGKVTVISQSPLNPSEVFDVFMSTLRVNGFTAVPTSSGTYRIVPEETAAQDAVPIGREVDGDQIITEVFKLRYSDVNTALEMIQPIVNRQGRAVSSRGSNAIIVVDYASNVQRIREVIASLDKDPSVMSIVTLRNTPAIQMSQAITELVKAQGDPANALINFTAVPVEGSNLLVLRGPPEVLNRMTPIVEELDARGAADGGTKVVYLRHAAAEDLQPLLERVSAMTRGGGAEGASGRANIAVDAGTNALVINAAPDVQRELADVIRQLDIRRQQVLVEAIIVEVSDTAARQLGVQYMLAGAEGSDIPFTATNFQGSPNLLAATGAIITDRETSGEDNEVIESLQALAVDSLLGFPGITAGFAGEGSDGSIFGVILNALQRDDGSNVLSTPSIMTMDNQPASILVGQEIPITTGESLGANNANPFRTVERQEVGVKLEVKPQINEGEAIKLLIRQEVSSIIGPINELSTDLVTNKRQIETTVMVDDGEVIVLGGLIEDDEQVTLEKIPLLGDIPVLGHLFSSEGTSRKRTNLMVFLRPTIVTDVDELRAVTGRKYDYIQAEQIRRSEEGTSSLDEMMNQIVGSGELSNRDGVNAE